eukprot:6395358-Pyramimonas_sp.AAC.1
MPCFLRETSRGLRMRRIALWVSAGFNGGLNWVVEGVVCHQRIGIERYQEKWKSVRTAPPDFIKALL